LNSTTITAERLSDFVNDTRRLLALSADFDRTLCYATRRAIRQLRFELSIKAGALAADLAAELANPEQLVAVERGAA